MAVDSTCQRRPTACACTEPAGGPRDDPPWTPGRNAAAGGWPMTGRPVSGAAAGGFEGGRSVPLARSQCSTLRGLALVR